MIPDNIMNELSRAERSRQHISLLETTRELVDMSRDKMGEYYDQWDINHDIFRSILTPDKEDRNAQSRKEPDRMVVPTAYAQIITFCAFCYSLFTQRERVFELIGVSEEDHQAAKIGEALLTRDLDINDFELKLFQHLLDICRFTIGIWEITWSRETRRVKEVVQQGMMKQMLGRMFGGYQSVQEVEKVVFLGNRIANISPYRFFPDTRLPLTRFHEGEFVASEDEFSYATLKQLEHEGVVAGIDHVKPMSVDMVRSRPGSTRTAFDFAGTGRTLMANSVGQSRHPILVTKVQRQIVPKDYMMDGVKIGNEDYPIKYIIWYANDDRIIKAEKLDYPHGKYTYELAQFIPDQHDFMGISFSESIDKLQSVISWFINSHITSVRKVISNHFVVDPSGIEYKDLQDRNPVIRLKPTAAHRGVERYIKQLEVIDVTSRHMDDVKTLRDITQEVTGVNDNLLGQFNTGRRSATEARNVTGSAASRLKMLASGIWKSSLKRMASQMLDNLRVGLDEETIVRVVGLERAQSGASFKKVTRADLEGSYDFEVFDGTLPSEKHFIAEALQEVLVAFFTNPEAAIALQIDPKKVFLEMLELRGVRNPERFTLPAVPKMVGNNGGPEQNGEVGPAPGVPGAGTEPVLPGVNGGGGAGTTNNILDLIRSGGPQRGGLLS